MTTRLRTPTPIEASPADPPHAADTTIRASLGAAPGCRRVEVDGVRLAFDSSGAGEAVVCLHAIGHGAGDFAQLRAALSARYRVIALDWPGHGRSAADHFPASAVRYAELLAAFMEAIEIPSAVLLGNSIGGAAAIRYAAAHLSRVRGLILENPGGLDRDPQGRTSRTAIAAMVGFFEAGKRGAWWYPAAFRVYYRFVLQRAAAAKRRQLICSAASEMAPVLAQAWRSFGEPEADLRDLVTQVRCPVLFAWAVRDQLVQLRRSRSAIARFPHAHIERFSAGHAAHLEMPVEFNASVERFLSELDARAAAAS